jgi:arsenate reductase-like glutaredoxin family protein
MAHKTRKELMLKLEELQTQVEKLLDENNSLWFMLDELDKSNITNPEYFKHIQEMMESVRRSRAMVTKDIGEA